MEIAELAAPVLFLPYLVHSPPLLSGLWAARARYPDLSLRQGLCSRLLRLVLILAFMLRQPTLLTFYPPTLNLHSDSYLRDPAISQDDWDCLERMNERLELDQLETCMWCCERWFDMRLNGQGVCARCVRDDNRRAHDEPRLFSADNNTDPGEMPAGLRALTEVEELLIARVHPIVTVRQHRGGQYHYREHVCSFILNVAKIYRKLPLLPRDINQLVLRPKTDNPRVNMQFKNFYRVRKDVLWEWLQFLPRYHAGYRHVEIDYEALNSLPVDASLEDELAVHEYDDPDVDDYDSDQSPSGIGLSDYDPPEPYRSAVPDVQPQLEEVDALRARCYRIRNKTLSIRRCRPFNRNQYRTSIAASRC